MIEYITHLYFHNIVKYYTFKLENHFIYWSTENCIVNKDLFPISCNKLASN